MDTMLRLVAKPVAVESPGRRWQWHAWANGLVLVWLAASAGLAAAAAAGAPVPAWLPVHGLLLGAASTAIVIWSEHFAVAVLNVAGIARRWPLVRLAVLTLGQAGVVAGVVWGVTFLVAAGAVLFTAAVAGHAVMLWRLRRQSKLAGRLTPVVDFYLAACVSVLAGAVLGALLGTGVAGLEPWHSRVHLAHIHLNVGGWVLLTVVGTLFMLLPTTLGTVIADSTQRAMRWCLWLAGPGLLTAVAGFLAGSALVAAAGIAVYLAGTAVAAWTFARTVICKRPHTGPAWMLTAAAMWLMVAVLADLIIVGWGWRGPVPQTVAALGPVLLAGVVVQVLTGSLMFLLPVVLGGGPAAVRACAQRLDRWWPARFTVLNTAVALLTAGAAGVSGWLTRLGLVLLVLAGADFVVRAGSEVAARLAGNPDSAPSRRAVMAGTAAGTLVTVFAVVIAASGGAVTSGGDSHGHGTAGQSQIVDVRLDGMRVTPAAIDVAAGTALTLRVSNTDSQPHDLRTGTGKRTALLGEGETAMLDLGVVNGPVNAWCTVAGHRAAGMTMTINVTSGHSEPGQHAAVGGPGFTAAFTPYDAALAAAAATTVHRVELPVVETELEAAPGVRQKRWTFGGTVPGPTLRGKVGDMFEVTLINTGSLGHGIDFHAGALAPDGPMRTIAPGERLTYRFTATRAGIWMYHCSTAPMTQHLGSGMFGAVIIDPPGLAPAGREYVLVASELYDGDPGGEQQVDSLNAGTPSRWAFNGTAAQYDHRPLTAKTGERVRFWVLNAGPGGLVSFHVVGGQFDTVYFEGNYLLHPGLSGGAQSLALAAAQGGFAEMIFPEAGHYAIVDHDMRHAEGGARGIVTVAN